MNRMGGRSSGQYHMMPNRMGMGSTCDTRTIPVPVAYLLLSVLFMCLCSGYQYPAGGPRGTGGG